MASKYKQLIHHSYNFLLERSVNKCGCLSFQFYFKYEQKGYMFCEFHFCNIFLGLKARTT